MKFIEDEIEFLETYIDLKKKLLELYFSERVKEDLIKLQKKLEEAYISRDMMESNRPLWI